MLKAPSLVNERERLRALIEYEILDTAAETSYDEVVRLASLLCGTPIALVSLIDEHRQWFKALHGLDVSETPREISFCGHAIAGKDVFEIPDTLLDERFFDNPLVTGMGLRFYAGAPLINDQGHALGTLCVVDQKVQTLSEANREALQSLAKIVVRELEARKALKTSNANYMELQKLSKTVEEQRSRLVFAEKMKSLGEMAGGIAHEINTPLTIIRSSASFVVRRIQDGTATTSTDVMDRLHQIDSTVARIADITKGMLLFSREGTLDDITACKVAHIIEGAVKLSTGSPSTSDVDIRIDPLSDISISCSEQRSLQIVTNLLNNAFDAVRNLEERWIRIGARTSSDPHFVDIYIQDSGKGIPKDIQNKIMEPFYTTKPPGQGTGLGLSISLSLAKAQGGTISIDNTSSNTCFIYSVPIKGVD